MKRCARPRLQAGFTIVETIIVLAIAGIILLIVLLAIPAVQRSSRNNQRKQDVNIILQAVSRYELNHSGSLPTSASFLASERLTYYSAQTVAVCPVSVGQGINIYTQVDAANSTSCTVPPTSVSSLPSGVSKLDTVIVANYARCDTNHPGQSNGSGAGFNDVVALFAIESGSSNTTQCQQL